VIEAYCTPILCRRGADPSDRSRRRNSKMQQRVLECRGRREEGAIAGGATLNGLLASSRVHRGDEDAGASSCGCPTRPSGPRRSVPEPPADQLLSAGGCRRTAVASMICLRLVAVFLGLDQLILDLLRLWGRKPPASRSASGQGLVVLALAGLAQLLKLLAECPLRFLGASRGAGICQLSLPASCCGAHCARM